MQKKHTVPMLITILLMTIVSLVLGLKFGKTEHEKLEGLSGVYDVSNQGHIAYIVYENGKPGIFLQHDAQIFKNPVFELDVDQDISDLSFSPDGLSLAYIVDNKDRQVGVGPGSLILLMDIQTFKQKRLFQQKGLVTEIVFDPKDSDLLFFVAGESIENESNMNVRSFQYDLFGHRISMEETIRYTELNQDMMHSLNVSASDHTVFVNMYDSDARMMEHKAKQGIFHIPIEDPENMSIVSKLNHLIDSSDFVVVPEENGAIFQSTSVTNKEGIYEYELYHYDWEGDQERQLTYMKENASRPVISVQDHKIFFMVDYQFGRKFSDYHLYEMDFDGRNVKKINLDLEGDSRS